MTLKPIQIIAVSVISIISQSHAVNWAFVNNNLFNESPLSNYLPLSHHIEFSNGTNKPEFRRFMRHWDSFQNF